MHVLYPLHYILIVFVNTDFSGSSISFPGTQFNNIQDGEESQSTEKCHTDL